MLCTWLLQHSADNLSNGTPEVRSVWQWGCSNITAVKSLRSCFLSLLSCSFHTLSPMTLLLSLDCVCVPALCWVSFLIGQMNKAFPGEADQALQRAQGTEQNCVIRTAKKDDGKKYNNIPSQWLWEVVRSVLFTPSNTYSHYNVKIWLVSLSWPHWRAPEHAMPMHRWQGFKQVGKGQERPSNPCVWAWI